MSPPLLALAFQSNPPPPPFNTIFMAIYYPAQILYHNAPWYREYIDFACKLLGV
jgi:hypothetical protein